MAKQRLLSERSMRRSVDEQLDAVRRQLPTFDDRLRFIDGAYTDLRSAAAMTNYIDLSRRVKRQPVVERYLYWTVERNLGSMSTREVAHLRVNAVMAAWSDYKDEQVLRWGAALLWADGKGIATNYQFLGYQTLNEAIGAATSTYNLAFEQVCSAIQGRVKSWLQTPNLHPQLRRELEEFDGKTSPRGGGGVWLRPDRVADSPYAPRSAYPLHLGTLPDGSWLSYSGDGSMITIAPPGSGKTQCNVFPNLLTWTGPAVVLDVSGDIYEHTAGWRARNVGPVYRFSPLEPESSHRYNPLAFVRSSADYIWEDSRLLAELMIVPSNSSDPFWENEARTVVTAAIAAIVYANPPERRPFNDVLDILFGGPAWDSMIRTLGMAVDVRVMMQHATSLGGMNEKTLSSVLQVARSSLSAWTGERIARVTSTSDWDPIDLRNGSNPTIYICMRPNEVDSYLSLLRVFIGQHIRRLTAGDVPAHGAPPILFMLDELPRLKNMPPVDEALNIGRKYGLRLWMFAQSVGQLQNAYENADGMMGSCAVRVYMNPSGADGLADKLSEEIGYADSVNDNSRRKIVEAAELAGPGYRDRQIVLANGSQPAIVTKNFAHQSPVLLARMQEPVPDVR
jgi:type IV secretion system protein VirD4